MRKRTFIRHRGPQRLGAAGLGLLSGLLLAGMAPMAMAVDDPGGVPSGDGVDPVFIPGNPSCTTLNTDSANFPGVTSNFGFKVDGSPNGTFPMNASVSGTSLTGGAPADASNSVTISNSDGTLFNWLATLGIDAVIVKGGPNADAFVYNPEDLADTQLHAPVNPENGQYYGISHIEFCYDYNLTATKTANALYTRTYTWSIDKSVDPATHSGFAGATFTSSYEVKVDQTVTDSNYMVDGEITVNNPTPYTVSFSVSDLVGGTAATVTCPTTSLAPGGSTTCDYTAALAANTNGTNTATITSSTSGVGGATASADYTFGNPTTTVGYPTINVTDSVQGALGSASGDYTFTYNRPFTCPTTSGSYTNGVYTFSEPNIATITETGQSDDATVTGTCYAPAVNKTASGSYKETHTWTINKTVDEESQTGYPGDPLSWTWTVNVSETSADSDFKVEGVITVSNPNPSSAMTVSIADTLSDGTVATLGCGGSLTVSPGSTGTCSYTANPSDKTATLNTATITLNGVSFSGTASVNFEKSVVGGTATVTDSEGGFDLTESITAGEGPWTYSKEQSETCSTNAEDYTENGNSRYTINVSNTATVTDSEGKEVSDDASTTYTCEAGFMDLEKTTDGVVDPTKDWKFSVYEGPDGFGKTQVGSTSSTLNDADGVLDFGTPVLSPDKTYTVCELSVPAGYSALWQLNGTIVVPYNPDADKVPPENNGNLCVDFGYGTEIDVKAGETLHFTVDNTSPGGAPRTPGYWKNWNRCTTGGQAGNADKNGGWQEGYWLVEDVLDPVIGGGIQWDDILSDSILVNITSCEYAVEILDDRVVTLNGKVGDGKKLASDAARNLAKHLLAAQLNFAAGACIPAGPVSGDQTIQQIALAAEELLDKKNFTGKETSIVLKSGTDATTALSLAGILDAYNNGMYCGIE